MKRAAANALFALLAMLPLQVVTASAVISSDGHAVLSESKEAHDDADAEHAEHPSGPHGHAHRWCPIAQLTPQNIELKQEPESDHAEVSGYCFYMTKRGQSCNDACKEQVAGTCDAFGTEFAAHSLERCQTIVKAFGGLKAGKGSKSENDRSGCTFSDTGPGWSKVQLMKKDDAYPLCSEEHNIPFSHRICACLPVFGDFSLFKETVGACQIPTGTGGQNRIKTGTFRSAAECQDECTRDSNCGAFAYVHPWDGAQRVCNFYGDGHTGDGANKHIRCHVKDSYLATVGRCKKHGARIHEEISSSHKETLNACKAACDEDELCKAYEVAEDFALSNIGTGKTCTLFKDGHTGDGKRGRRCYTKAMAGVKPM